MGRPRNSRCRVCKRDLPDEMCRDELTIGTDVCLRCAATKLAEVRRTSRAARDWLLTWRERLRHALDLVRQQ